MPLNHENHDCRHYALFLAHVRLAHDLLSRAYDSLPGDAPQLLRANIADVQQRVNGAITTVDCDHLRASVRHPEVG